MTAAQKIQLVSAGSDLMWLNAELFRAGNDYIIALTGVCLMQVIILLAYQQE